MIYYLCVFFLLILRSCGKLWILRSIFSHTLSSADTAKISRTLHGQTTKMHLSLQTEAQEDTGVNVKCSLQLGKSVQKDHDC